MKLLVLLSFLKIATATPVRISRNEESYLEDISDELYELYSEAEDDYFTPSEYSDYEEQRLSSYRSLTTTTSSGHTLAFTANFLARHTGDCTRPAGGPATLFNSFIIDPWTVQWGKAVNLGGNNVKQPKAYPQNFQINSKPTVIQHCENIGGIWQLREVVKKNVVVSGTQRTANDPIVIDHWISPSQN
jgi:hypothetical protein